LGLVVGLGVFALLLLGTRETRPLALGLLAAAGLALTTLAFLDRFEAASRLASIGHNDVSMDLRFEVWKETLRMASRYPILGVGLGAFEHVIPRFKDPAQILAFLHPENDYLYLLAEGGLPAL